MKTALEELLAFHTVVDTGSVMAAAKQLDQAASGVSRVLCCLEEKLDTILLSCIMWWLSPTDGDATFLAQTRRILATVNEAKEQIALRRQQPASYLRASAATPFMLHVVTPLVPDSHARYPQTELELNTNNLIIDLLEEDTNMATRVDTLRDSTPCARLLGTRRLCVPASPAYLKTHGRPRYVDSPQKHALLDFVQPEPLNQRPLRDSYGDRPYIEPTSKIFSREALRQLALQGTGIVCLADFITVEDRHTGDLVQVLLGATVEVLQPIHAVHYRNAQLASRITCFLDFPKARLVDDKQ